MLLADSPIKSRRGDKLRRAALADRVADGINGLQGEESLVLGIEGPWGSGKLFSDQESLLRETSSRVM